MKTILAVDDEPHILRLIQFTLERAGYEVVTAQNGAEALKVIDGRRPALIISDVMMPYVNGFEFLRRLRANSQTADIPVILLTVRSSDTDISDAWSMGVDLYLPKPFMPAELISFVERLLPEAD